MCRRGRENPGKVRRTVGYTAAKLNESDSSEEINGRAGDSTLLKCAVFEGIQLCAASSRKEQADYIE